MAEEDESSPEGAHQPIDEEDDDADGTMREIMETPTSRRSRTRTRSPVAARSSSAKASGSAAKASGVGGTTIDSSTVAKAKTTATGAETTTSGPAVLPKTMGAAPSCGVLQQGIYTVVWDPNTNVRVGQAGQAMRALQLSGIDQHGSMLFAPCFPVSCQLKPRERQWAASQGLRTSVSKQDHRLQISLTILSYTTQLHPRQCARRKISNHQSRPWWPPPYTETTTSAVHQCAPLITQAGDVRPTEPDSTMDKNRPAMPAHMCAQLPARDCILPRSDSIPPNPLQIPLKPAHPCDSFTSVNGEIACCEGTFSDEATYEVSQPGTDTCLGISRADRGVAATMEASYIDLLWQVIQLEQYPPVPDRRGTGYYEKDLEGEAGLPVRNPDSEPKVADPKRAGTEASSSSTPRSKEGSVKVDQAPSMEMAMGEEESDLLVDKMIQLAKATATRFGVTSEQLLDAVQLTWLPALEQKLWRTTETCLLCSHSPGNLREWQQHLLTKSHSRIANEAKMTWYHLYLVMSIHDDRMRRQTGKPASQASSNEPSLVSQNAALLFEQLVEDLHKAQ
ncbi:unnamed protein product [Symbiodinium natans]|uniref:Uncharacterized protein n=1 Tax=Symbiodinium natans TaxID=878477 RepID=A0A812UJP7_9DINO|nr:unnamed protein product [Symbiodinium natans]